LNIGSGSCLGDASEAGRFLGIDGLVLLGYWLLSAPCVFQLTEFGVKPFFVRSQVKNEFVVNFIKEKFVHDE
jgi:hypothetical protein